MSPLKGRYGRLNCHIFLIIIKLYSYYEIHMISTLFAYLMENVIKTWCTGGNLNGCLFSLSFYSFSTPNYDVSPCGVLAFFFLAFLRLFLLSLSFRIKAMLFCFVFGFALFFFNVVVTDEECTSAVVKVLPDSVFRSNSHFYFPQLCFMAIFKNCTYIVGGYT